MATIALLSRYGSKSAYDIEFGVNSIGFFSGKFLPWLVFWLVLRGGVWSWLCNRWILWPI